MKLLANLVVVALLLITGSVMAQEATPDVNEAAEIVQVVFDDLYVVDIPADWLTWRYADYAIPSLGSQAIVDMVQQVDPDYVFETPPTVTYLRFAAVSPTMIDEQMITMKVTFLPLSEVAASAELEPSEIRAIMGISAFGYEPIGEMTINGREAAIGYRTSNAVVTAEDGTQTEVTQLIDVMVISIFPDQDTIALTSIIFPPSYFESNPRDIARMLLSLRLVDEPFDAAALATFMGDDVAPEATPEATDAP